MTKLLLGQSYYLQFDAKLWEAMQPYPPLGTMYTASYLRQRGYEVALFDAMLAESESEWQQRLDSEKPDYAVIYEDNFNYLSKMCLARMRQAAFTMIAMAREAGLPVIVAGSDASDHWHAYLTQGADYVLIGEGEQTLADLLARLEAGGAQDWSTVAGLAYHDGDQPRSNGRRADIKTLDELPFPAWDLIDIPRYRAIWEAHHGYYSMNMVTTRGCPYHCNWCAKPIWGQRYNTRSPANVVAELKWLKETYRPDHIWFADDIMGLKPGWWQTFADLVEQEGARVPFKCLSRADLVVRSAENVHALRRAGCDILWMGAESGSQAILNAMEKGTTVAQIYEATAQLQKGGVRVGFFLQFGYPGETRADIERTLQMVRDCAPDDVGMSVSYPLPGTTFYDRVKMEFGDQQNWYDSADLAMMYNGQFTTDFYRQLHVVLHKEFRSRRAVVALKTALRSPRTLNRRHLREVIASLYRMATLPSARRKLNGLAQHQPENPVGPLPHVSLEEAARPTPQAD